MHSLSVRSLSFAAAAVAILVATHGKAVAQNSARDESDSASA